MTGTDSLTVMSASVEPADLSRAQLAQGRAPLNARVVSLRGLTNYTEALELQYSTQEAVRQGTTGNTLYLLEHPPVVTIGRGAGRSDKDLLTSRANLSMRGIDVVDADRGGDTTYHAPGQLVGYSIVDLRSLGKDLHRYIRSLEAIVVSALSELGVNAGTISGLTGVWVGNNKIAAIGIKVSRWVSMHGFSLNIDPDLAVMRRDIVPCGITDKGVVSLRELAVIASRPAIEILIAERWLNEFGTSSENVVHQEDCATLLYRRRESVLNGECRRAEGAGLES